LGYSARESGPSVLSVSANSLDLSVVRLRRPDDEMLLFLEACDREAFGATGLRTYDLAVLAEAGAIYLASIGGDFVGSAQLMRVWDEPGFCYVVGLYVRPSWQKMGIGRRLLREVEELCRRGRVEGLLLTVSPHNVAALALYKSVGFVEEELVPHFYGKGEDRSLLRRWFEYP
jgi:ribosomal protein S18 acetylase RimI-like enzyme